jgi:hypothetical protein
MHATSAIDAHLYLLLQQLRAETLFASGAHVRHASWSSRPHLPASASLSCAASTNTAASRTSVAARPGTRLPSFTKHLERRPNARERVPHALAWPKHEWGHGNCQKRTRAASLHIMTSKDGCILASKVMAGALLVCDWGDATWTAHRADGFTIERLHPAPRRRGSTAVFVHWSAGLSEWRLRMHRPWNVMDRDALRRAADWMDHGHHCRTLIILNKAPCVFSTHVPLRCFVSI